MASWDVIVVGLGGVGSAAACHLAMSGNRVLGIDQFAPTHDRGSSHGKTRVIRQAYFEDPAYVPLLKRAYALWDELEQIAGERLFYRTGLVELGPTNGVVIPGVLRSAREHDLEVEELSVAELTRRWPGIGGHQDWQVVIERNAGFLRVEACVQAHLRTAHQYGASCLHGAKVDGWEVDGEGVSVFIDQSVERADRLVLAGGPWSSQLMSQLGLKLQVLRKHQYWFDPKVAGFELDDGFPCFFHETPEGYFYGFPSIDGSGVKVARHSGGTPVDQPSEGHADDPHDRTMVDRFVAEFLPGVGEKLVDQAGCYYTVTADEHFVIDRHPEHPQVTIVAGLSGHGFKFTSVLGEIAAQLSSDQATAHEIELFAIDRDLS